MDEKDQVDGGAKLWRRLDSLSPPSRSWAGAGGHKLPHSGR